LDAHGTQLCKDKDNSDVTWTTKHETRLPQMQLHAGGSQATDPASAGHESNRVTILQDLVAVPCPCNQAAALKLGSGTNGDTAPFAMFATHGRFMALMQLRPAAAVLLLCCCC
jgi:hypothetical protein